MLKSSFCGRFTLALLVLAFISSTTVARAQTVSVVYSFGSRNGDPVKPLYSGIIAQGRDGNLYSTAPQGGANNLGAAFKITPGGTETVLFNFDGSHGIPWGGLTLAPNGNFYGTTIGGTAGGGTVFRMTPRGALTVLHNLIAEQRRQLCGVYSSAGSRRHRL
jgi:uncharacterized repeat protein (TIGR03803 family)